MKITSVFKKNDRHPVVVLGKFDGLHRGHKTLIDIAKSISEKNGKPVYIFTFKGGISQKLLTDDEFFCHVKNARRGRNYLRSA